MKKKREQGFIEKIVRWIINKYLPGFYLAQKPPRGRVRKVRISKPVDVVAVKNTEAIS